MVPSYRLTQHGAFEFEPECVCACCVVAVEYVSCYRMSRGDGIELCPGDRACMVMIARVCLNVSSAAYCFRLEKELESRLSVHREGRQ